MLKENAQGYRITEENSEIPLKRFLACDYCGKPMRGSIVKKKNLHYYKCSTKACNNNKIANALNTLFERILYTFRVDKAKCMIEVVYKQAIAKFNELTTGDQDDYRNLQDQHTEILKKINRLEERYVEEEIGGDLYRNKYDGEKVEIEENLMKLSRQVSNLDENFGFAMQFALELPLKRVSADYNTKKRIQFLLFPEDISYSKKRDECRTPRINLIFLYISYFQQLITNKKRGIPELGLDFASFATLVESSCNLSNFYDHCEAVINFEKIE